MAYTTINKSTDHFSANIWNGTGSAGHTITTGHNTDMIWFKQRNGTQYHQILDDVRGLDKPIYPNDNLAQGSGSTRISSTTSTGFVLGDGNNDSNGSGNTYVGWSWKANGQGSSNTDGSINTTYTSVNTTAGFSISQYAGNSSAGATIGHGLGAIPQVIIVKNISQAEHWIVYHHKSNATPEDYYYRLNSTNAVSDFEMWNDTAPTSSVFSLGTNDAVNHNGSNHVAYCFAEKKGFSKFGSYTGNGNADGSFIYTGFKPAFMMTKRSDSGNSWYMYSENTSTTGGNLTDKYLEANESNAEATTTGEYGFDFLSNGFKARGTGGGTNNGSGTYVYMAFAEAPLVGSNNVPCTAR